MNRHDPDMLDRITSVAAKWRRRCNGMPAEGIVVNAAWLRVVLASSTNVTVGPGGVIVWPVDGRRFTFEPVKEEPAE